MEKRIVRRPILIAAAGIAGVLTLLAGYVESQAAAKFEFEVASVRPQALSDDQAEVSASTSSGGPVMTKPHLPAKVHSAVKTKAGTLAPKPNPIALLSESTEPPVESHVESNTPTHADIKSLMLLAGAAQKQFALGLRVQVMQDGTILLRHPEKSDRN